MSSISKEVDIKMVEGIDFVRPPSLDFKEVKNNKDFIEYEITTGYQSDKRMGKNSFINYIKSFIFCNETLTIQVPKKSYMIRNGKKRFALGLKGTQPQGNVFEAFIYKYLVSYSVYFGSEL